MRARIQRFANSCIYDDAFNVEEGAELALLVHRTRSIKSSLSVSVYLSRRRPLSASQPQDDNTIINPPHFLLFRVLQFLVDTGGKKDY